MCAYWWRLNRGTEGAQYGGEIICLEMAGEKRQPSSSLRSLCSVEVSVALTTILHAHQARSVTPTNTHSLYAPCKGLSSQVLSLPEPLENLIMRALRGNLSAVYSASLYTPRWLSTTRHMPHTPTLSPHFKADDVPLQTHADNIALSNFL